MKIYDIPTDEALRSTLAYGSHDFPFACFLDEPGKFHSRCIEWHWHRELEFSLVLRGTVRCRSGAEVFTLSSGDGLFVNSEVIHRFEADDDSLMVNIVFAPEFIADPSTLIFSRYVEPLMASSCTIIPFPQDMEGAAGLLSRLNELQRAARTGSPAGELTIRNCAALLWEALLELRPVGVSQPAQRGDKLLRARMQKMVGYIHAHYPSPISLADIASAANISVSEALRCFRAAAQTTPIRYLNDRRLARAKEMLLDTCDTVIAIAAASGFENPSYFCRIFRKRYGASPNELRKAAAHPAAAL